MFVTPPPQSEDADRIYRASLESQGFPMNLTKVWAWRPEVFEGFAALRAQLTNNSALTKRDLSVLVSATAAAIGDSYCALAWGATLAHETSPAVASAILTNHRTGGVSERDQALAQWARKVAKNPSGTLATDVSDLREAGLTEREIVETTVFVAFRIAFSTVNAALGANPDWQLAAAAPPEVVRAVDFGRPVAAKPAAPAGA